MIWLLLFAFSSVASAYTVVQPEISLLEPAGIRFAYPDDGQTNMVGYHYSINQPLNGVDAGEFNFDVNTPTNGYFVLEKTDVVVYPGDVVSYWVNVITDTGGYLLTDQTWVAPAPTTPTIPPLPTTTTEAVTTTPPHTNNPPTETEPAQTATTAQTTTTTVSGGSSGGSSSGGSGNVISASCSKYPCDGGCDQSAPPCNGLIFEEKWDDLDLDRWEHELTMGGGGNWEFQMYTNNRSNSYVKDNTLFIKPTLLVDQYGESFLSSGTIDMWGGSPADFCTGPQWWGCMRTGTGTNYLNPVKSARIRTVNSFAFKYGRVEVEAKMPTGDWLWPAIWFLPKRNRYGMWPASGEIDLLESRGNSDLKDSNGVSIGNDAMGSTLHWGPFWPVNGYEKTTKQAYGNFASEFHKYSFDWNEDGITFFVDGTQTLHVDPGDKGFWTYGDFETVAPGSDNPWKESTNKMTPFDQEFYMLINLAVGGTNGYFPDGTSNGNGAKPWNNNSPTAARDFWQAKNTWYPTWQPDVNDGENAALQIRKIQIWAN